MTEPIVVGTWSMVRRALWVPCFIHTRPLQRPPDPWLEGWYCGCRAWNDTVPRELGPREIDDMRRQWAATYVGPR